MRPSFIGNLTLLEVLLNQNKNHATIGIPFRRLFWKTKSCHDIYFLSSLVAQEVTMTSANINDKVGIIPNLGFWHLLYINIKQQ